MIIFNILTLIIGFAVLIKGADMFVDNSTIIARKVGISSIVIGLTIAAIGTSSPELAVSLSAILKGTSDITIGNVLGSCIFNILIILGICSLIKPIKVVKRTMKFELNFLILTAIIIFLLSLDNKMSFSDGLILLILLVQFIIYLIRLAKEEKRRERKEKIDSISKPIFLMLFGLGTIILSSYLVVESGVFIAQYFKISERIIGLTVIAMGTGLPELATSISAIRKKNYDIVVGNILGSNIYNILLVLGLSSVLVGIPSTEAFRIDYVVYIFSCILLSLFMFAKDNIDKKEGGILISVYILYLIYLIIG